MVESLQEEIEEERRYFGLLTSYALDDRKNLILTIIMLFIGTGIAIAAPLFFQRALSIVEQIETGTPVDGLLQPLLMALLFYFVLSLTSWFTNASITIFSTRLNAGIIQRMRKEAFSSLLTNNMSFFDKSASGNTVSILTSDLNELYETGNAITQVVTAVLKLIGVLAILFYFSFWLTLSSLLLLPIFFFVTLYIRKFRRNAERQWRQNFGKVNQSFAEILRSIEVSKTFNRDKDNVKQFTMINEATYDASIKRGAAIFLSRPVADFLRNILLIMILGVGTFLVQQQGLSVTIFYLFIFLLDYYYEPVRAIARNYARFQSLFANLERVLSIAHFSDPYDDKFGITSLKDFSGSIEFDGVSFSYDSSETVLEDINFVIQPGQRVALVGHTGSGKSTIANLIMGLYQHQQGQILLDGKSITTYSVQSLRSNIGLVSQSILLFKGTIRENLVLAGSDITDEEIWEAIDAVQAQEFIESLPSGLDTMVEENGKNLSTGQRQMLSYARTLLSKPQMIILDEATSAVDLYTEAKIQQATELLLEGTTSLVIAHRLTTIIRSDLIIVLDKGKIVQKGTHERLLQQDGPYREMYDLYFRTQSAKYLETIKR